MPSRDRALRPPGFTFLPMDQLSTSYAALRPGRAGKPSTLLAPLPVRVVAVAEDRYEVLDGFKRLATWRDEGYREVPVVLESARASADHKVLLLVANAPARTLTTLDEVEITASLRKDDGLSELAIARALKKTLRWVVSRLDIDRHLGAAGKDRLARGAIGPSAAHVLCGLSDKDQAAVLAAAEHHGLTERASIALFEAYRVADEADRKRLLRDPKGILEPAPSPAQSPLVTALERRLERIRSALLDLTCFSAPVGLSPPEARRIDAVFRSVLIELEKTAVTLLGLGASPAKIDDGQRRQERQPRAADQAPARRGLGGDPGPDHRAARQGLWDPQDRPASRLLPEDRSPRPP